MTTLDETHDPMIRSWIETANGHTDFPIQNLPFGMFRRGTGETCGGIAVGDQIVDVRAALSAGIFCGEGKLAAEAACGPVLNPLFDLPASAAREFRHQLFAALREDGTGEGKDILVAQAEVEMAVPVRVGAFTDFLCSHDHTNRISGGNPPPAFDYFPIAYNGRATSVTVSGEVRRPLGQWRTTEGDVAFGPEPMLDYELELGVILRSGNRLGEPLTVAAARDAIFGYCLLNDWSARGIQFLETQPLGPFLGKNFATTISPWIVTADALAPFGAPARNRRDAAPATPAHLLDDADQARGNLDIDLEAWLTTRRMRESGVAAARIAATNADICYWTFAQMIAHHSSNGCNLQPGDLLGSGTLSGPTDGSRACLAEVTSRGRFPFNLPNGETRIYLEDGDEIVLRGFARRQGRADIGFGDCRCRIVAAREPGR